MEVTRLGRVRQFNLAAEAFLRDLAVAHPEVATPEFRETYASNTSPGEALLKHFCRSTHGRFDELAKKSITGSLAVLPHVDLARFTGPRAKTGNAAAVWAHVRLLQVLACDYQLDPAHLAKKAHEIAASGNREKAAAWILYLQDMQIRRDQLLRMRH